MLCYDLYVVLTAEPQRAQSPYIFHLPVTCLAIAQAMARQITGK